MQLREFFYASNLMSLSRIPLTVPMVLLIRSGESTGQLLAWMTIVGLTDIFDGILARRLNQATKLGQILDPVCDKIVMAFVFLALVLYRGFPLALVLLLLFRDALIVAIGLVVTRHTKAVAAANVWGKANTFFFGITSMTFVVSPEGMPARVLVVACYITLAASGTSYYVRGENMLPWNAWRRWVLRVAVAGAVAAIVFVAR